MKDNIFRGIKRIQNFIHRKTVTEERWT